MNQTDFDQIQLYLVLTAAGSSSRMGTGSKKEYISLQGGTVLSTAASVFFKAAHFEKVVITHPQNGEEAARDALFADSNIKQLSGSSQIYFVTGGSTRQQSVYNALAFLKQDILCGNKKRIVLIHDAARPFVTEKIVKDTIASAVEYGASVPAINVVDTQKEINADGTINRHLVRSELKAVQTPQAFVFDELFECHKKARLAPKEFTDDTEIWDCFPECTGGKKVHIVEGNVCNKKITYRQDLDFSEVKGNKMNVRTGLGTDFHKLVEGRKFFLGGVEIPSEKGEEAHSDGDVLLHAIADALLGASGLGDIGTYFPPEEAEWKDADSAFLLKTIWSDVKKKGWSLGNLDCVLEFEKPKFIPYRQSVIENIAEILEVKPEQIFVKAKTNEKLDAVGRGEAIKAYCTCLLVSE